MGPEVMLIDSAESMADTAATLLTESSMANPSRTPPEYRFYVTDVPYRFQTIGEHFLGRSLSNIEVVKL
jgi:glutamate racemase